MGSNHSSLTSEEIGELRRPEISSFSEHQIARLYSRFQSLDRDNSGYIEGDDFRIIPELSMNPLSGRVITLFTDNNDRCNFKQFVQLLWVFSSQCSIEIKTDFVFRCYDVDGDGVVSVEDLKNVLQMLAGSNLPDAQLATIAQATISSCESAENGTVNRTQFKSMISADDIRRHMTLEF